ncbi:MAG: hypothetical protein JXB47_19485 [Anaerolineae bacterium]|nr:hypothetical protein [Anaerolineae bacterium]
MHEPNSRAFAFIIGAGILLMAVALGVSAVLGHGAAGQWVGVLGAGLVILVGGTLTWVIVEKPVVDPYKQPPPSYDDHDHGH